ncbi:MAG: LTA synthase family protein [Allomuricauda sp.]
MSISLLVRLIFLIWNFEEVSLGILALSKTLFIGLLFDTATASFLAFPYLLYLLLFPARWYGSLVDRGITFFGFFLGLFVIYFSFLGEFTFWDEFQRRYNFIAVDYLVYTYEVVQNINESYPLPLLLGILLALVALTFFLIHRFGIFRKTFQGHTSLKQRIIASLPWFTMVALTGFFLTNDLAEWSTNRYNNELSKAGIFSFFAAFRNNELAYDEFYKTIGNKEALEHVKMEFVKQGETFLHPNEDEILRSVKNKDSVSAELRPNIVFVCIESLSANYLTAFGNELNITPTLDTLVDKSIFFTNLYATGTRTVRGMEAITLSIPPTPGRSIIKRKKNTGLFTIGEVFKEKGYDRNFFYGGDGYFDNMNTYFSGNGFNIFDRGRGYFLDGSIKTQRTNIEDSEVTFENAWGVCDGDIYAKVIEQADMAYATGRPFFDFVMTTSNHKPFTYPGGKIDIASGTGRKGAVKYTDFALGEFLDTARKRPWFQNTVFVIMSDHCASSAGRWELDVQNYHIPALIYNLPNVPPQKVDRQCSQIDMFPTLFGLLRWDYTSNFFGRDIFKMDPRDERAFIGNYRKLGLLKGDKVMVLGDQKKANLYHWNSLDNSLEQLPMSGEFLKNTISWYEVADHLYRNEGLKSEK